MLQCSGALEASLVRVHAVDVFIVDFSVLHHHDDVCEVVEYAEKEAKAVLLVAQDAVGLCVFGACVFDEGCPQF
jgi:hypothetical protein